MSGTADLRVLTWNIWGLRGNPAALTRVLRSADADVVCLQEAPRWPGSRWELTTLARRCGLLFVDGGRSAGGCAILASLRADVRSVRALRLPVAGRFDPPRGVVVAEVSPIGCEGIAMACVHLSLKPQERLDHVALIRQTLARLELPRVLVAGDLNETADAGKVWSAWAPVCTDPTSGIGHAGPTFPAQAPRSRIDAILTAGVEVVDYDTWRPDDADVRASSDHRPVLAVLRVPRRSRPV